MKFQIGDIAERIAYDHGNVKTGEKRTVIELNCGLYDNKVRLSGDMPDYTHDPDNLKLIKHKDIPFEEIPDGAIFTMRYHEGKHSLIAKKVPLRKNSSGLCSGPIINNNGQYCPDDTYGVKGDATFSLSTPDEIAELVAHMGDQQPQTTQHHYLIY